MKKSFFLFLVASTLLILSFNHGYHVGIAEVYHNEKTEIIEIAIKVATEDLIFVLEKKGAKNTDIANKETPHLADSLISKYLNQHFKLVVNNEPKKLSYLGKEVEIHDTWCYVEVPQKDTIKTIVITNTIFIEYMPEQVNRVNLKINGKEKSAVLSKVKPKETIQL